MVVMRRQVYSTQNSLQHTEPTQGRAFMNGRVGVFWIGTGFHLELTGRENIYLSGAILSMKRAEIDRSFDEIVPFLALKNYDTL